MRCRRALCVVVVPMLALIGCDRKAPTTPPPEVVNSPSFVQRDFAKDPDADCESHPPEHYAALTATQLGLEELAMLHCQLSVRGEYHSNRSSELKGSSSFSNENEMAMRCMEQNIAVLKSMQKAGVTATHC